jgi:hypothetical protein
MNQQQSVKSNSAATIFDLPREIRDEIYCWALHAPTDIHVLPWEPRSLGLERQNLTWYLEWVSRWRKQWAYLYDPMKSKLRPLAFNLLLCQNRTVVQEAAMVFYKQNTFYFEDFQDWNTAVFWLETIGPNNRNSLRNVKIRVPPPSHSWQKPDGIRVQHPGNISQEQLYQRHPYLQLSSLPVQDGEVENLDPIIEDIFILLKSRISKTTIPLKLDLMLISDSIPGVEIKAGSSLHNDNFYHFTTDLPNLIEKFRSDHTADCVEVRWFSSTDEIEFIKQRTVIEEKGWTILQCKKRDPPASSGYEPQVDFILKRENQSALFIASDPSPYTLPSWFAPMRQYY